MASASLPRHYGAAGAAAGASTPGLKASSSNDASSSAFVGLPRTLTPSTRVSRTTLPIDSHAKIRWQSYTLASASTQAEGAHDTSIAAYVQAVQHLKELSQEEAVGNASAERAEKPAQANGSLSALGLSLASAALWTYVADQDGTKSVWAFDVEAPSSSAEPDTAAARRKARDRICAQLGKMDGCSSSSGSFALDDVYPAWSSPVGAGKDGEDHAAHLLPRAETRQPLRLLLCALEDFYLRRWVWARDAARQQPELVGAQSDAEHEARPAAADHDTKTSDRTAMDVDDEEEGALTAAGAAESKSEAAGEADKRPFSAHDLWPSTASDRFRVVRRFRRGVIIEPIASLRQSLLEDAPSQQALHCGLRCSLNDLGQISLSTHVRDIGLRRCDLRQDADISGREIFLAPTGMRATLKGIQDLPDDGESPSAGHIAKAWTKLAEALRLDDAPFEEMPTQWALCESLEGTAYLWPAPLCLEGRSESARDKNASTGRPKARFSSVRKVGEDAVDLVQEAVGMPVTIADSDDDAASASDGPHANESDEDEVKASDDETKGVGDVASDQNANVAIEGQSSRAPDAVKSEEKGNLQPDPIAKTSKANSASRRPSRSNEDELDLWGSFGFGSADEIQVPAQPPSRDGLDDAGFGFVTEDDFSFFDDGAANFAGFDAPDLDMITEEPELDADSAPADTEMLEDTKNAAQAAVSKRFSLDEHDNTSNAAQSVSQTTMTDPPSLPGFTPGSFSTASPNHGGQSKQTPRTPFSPSQEMADMNVRIEGEPNALGPGGEVHARDMIDTPLREEASPPSATKDPHESSLQGSLPNIVQPWMQKNRRGIGSKYQDGKYALPVSQVQHKQDQQKTSTDAPSLQRSRVLPRRGQRSDIDPTTRGPAESMADLHKSRLRIMRGDDGNSDLTDDDGTMSEWSSRYDSDDESVTSDADGVDAAEDMIMMCAGMMEAAQEALSTAAASSSGANTRPQDVPPSSRSAATALSAGHDIDGVLQHFVDDLQARRTFRGLAPATQDEAIVPLRDAWQLFTPLEGALVCDVTLDSFLKPCASAAQMHGASLAILPPPRVVLGYQGAVISAVPTILPFWRQLRLQAVCGPKHVTAFGLYAGEMTDAITNAMQEWFTSLGQVFSERGLGTHCLAQDGLLSIGNSRARDIAPVLHQLALDEETWSDTLASIVSRFSQALSERKAIVLYATGPAKIADANRLRAYCKLERDLRKLAAERFGSVPHLIHVRCLPWDVVCSSRLHSLDTACESTRFAMALYDSVPSAISPIYNAEEHLPSYQASAVPVRAPCFSVLPSSPKPGSEESGSNFELEWKTESLNFSSGGSVLHFGYRLASSPNDVTVVIMTDERGHETAISGWKLPEASLEQHLRRILAFVAKQMSRVRVLWRLVLCKDSPMSGDECRLWSRLLTKSLAEDHALAQALDVTLTCVDTTAPLAFLPETESKRREAQVESAEAAKKQSAPMSSQSAPEKAGSANKTTESSYIDASRLQYAMLPGCRVPLITLLVSFPVGLIAS